MTTRKAKTASKKVTKKAASKPTAAAKKAAAAKKKATEKKAADLAKRKIVAVAGQDEHFYHSFPRYHAYTLLLSAPKKTMLVKDFIAKVEKLEGVKSRAQANGIMQKLLDKKRHVGVVCAKLS